MDFDWEKTFKTAFTNSPHGIAIVSNTGEILFANNVLCDFLGYQEEDLIHKTFQEITHPDDLQSDLDLYHKVLDKKIDNYSIVKRYIRNDASEVWCQLNVGGVFDDDKNFLYFVSQVKDIHEEFKKEQQLYHIGEESKRFLKIISHDMREPLREISYELVKISSMSESAGLHLENYLKNIERLLGVVANILEDLSIYSNISMFQEKNKAIDILDVRHFLETFFPRISFILNDILHIGVDKDDFFNLINQLFLNSIKFKHKGKESLVSLECYDAVGEWILLYKDNGIGIYEKFWDKVFDPLFQIDEKKYSGNGIGLSICRKICHKYSGDIVITESSDVGTTFKINLKK